ncbi:mechanosensitive ion channel family protein [Marinirhabdus gelatinilytica]|uniref:Small-conductance mechanosensitive channel n=1 Tax=Marinirhabdus gelatinilytica TaxID=1703343 RepID=A0A370QAU5_9FLAO|nr:mechanosensitive ion channel domain-containing protein [Marinirhabdus gelatinilytica]RDK85501.1 small-conductance mechanosensitive channel [Marinirhabdus gelatinilytica]
MKKIVFYITLCIGIVHQGYAFQDKESDSTEVNNDKNLPSKDYVIKNEAQYGNNPFDDYNEAFYRVDRLNEQIGLPPTNFNLRTPQAVLEHFVISARNGKYEDAIHALNLNLMPLNLTEEQAIVLAKKLYFVMNQRVTVDWDALSDRPDGQIDISTTTNQAIAGKPRRSVVFGEVEIDGRDIVLRVQRIRYKEFGALWLISANTVENIEPLYEVYGPKKMDRIMPQWANVPFLGISLWKLLGTLLLGLLAYIVMRITIVVARKLFLKSEKGWIKNIANKLAKPAGLLIGTLFFYITLNALISLSGAFANFVYTSLIIMIVASITWFVTRMVDYLMTYIAENKVGDISEEENEEARKLLTYISVGRRIVTFLIVIIGGYFIISQFRALEKVGISILASAGVATVILGIAAQNTLGNIFAGLQIAITRPVKVGDTVIINDDWGNVEEIGFTYLVIRTWDLRRLIVPLKWVISNIFENWSMTSSHQIRPITIHADYNLNVPKVREKFETLVKESEDWDEDNPPILEVVDVTEKSIKLRALCSAKDATTAWKLHCKLREELVAYISKLQDGAYLSKKRLDIKDKS